MGSFYSATLVIHLDNSEENVAAGSFLTGKVYMDVVVDKLDAESLMIRLVGKEKVEVRYEYDGNRTAQSDDQSTFLDVNVPLVILDNGYFSRGRYEFPFSLIVPPVKSSMRCEIAGSKGGFAEIKYFIEARVHRRGCINWDVSTSKKINVVSFQDPASVPKIQGYVKPHEEKVYLCGCINRGSIAIGMSTPSNRLALQGSFAASYVIQNESSAVVKAVEFTIVERVTWTSREIRDLPTHVRYRGTAKAIFSLRIKAADLNGEIVALNKEGKAMLDETAIRNRLTDALDSNNNVISGQIAGKYSTCIGTLVRVHHALEMTVHTTFGTNNPQITIPLILYHSSARDSRPHPITPPPPTNNDQKYTSLPSDWNAHVYEALSLPMPICVKAAAVHCEPDAPSIDAGPQKIPILSSPQHASGGIDRLLQSIEHSFDASSAFSNWLRENQQNNDNFAVDALTPDDFGNLFGSIRGMLDQVTIAERLVEARSSVTSLHVARAAAASFDVVRADVIARLAAKVL